MYAPWQVRSNESNDNLPLPLPYEPLGENQSLVYEKDESEDICLIYPLLQPQSLSDMNQSTSTNSSHPSSMKSKNPNEIWSKDEGFVRFAMYGDHPLSRIFDSSWKMFADINIKDLVDSSTDKFGGFQNERRGWVNVRRLAPVNESSSDLNTTASGIEIGGDFDLDICNSNSKNNNMRDTNPSNKDISLGDSPSRYDKAASNITGAQILVRIQLELPSQYPSKIVPFNHQDIEKSALLEKILFDKEEKSENALTVLFNMRDNIKYVQNLMSYILNAMESYKNLFNWTSPGKTYPIYYLLIIIWLATVCIPGRYLILAIGLYQFLFRFLPEIDPVPNEIRLQNIMEALPNDDDIQKAYFREQKAFVKSKEDELKLKSRFTKLNLVSKALWQGNVLIKAIGIGNGIVWTPAFSVLQETRFVWWHKEEDVDEGKAPQGQLLLFGHAGITQPSPVDVRDIGGDSHIATIFGRDPHGMPHKWTVVCKDYDTKENLISVVNNIVEKNRQIIS